MVSDLADSIDHVVIATPNLEAARKEFMGLGFQVTPHGVHERYGTENYLVILEDSYIELLGITGCHPQSRASLDILEPCIAAGGGVPMLALAVDDMEAAYKRVRDLGIDVQEPVSWSRLADTPDGVRTASFTTMFLDEPILPTVSVFYCKHHTISVVRHPAWRRHPNGASSLLGLTLCLDFDPVQAQCLCDRLGGVQDTHGHTHITFGDHQLTYRAEAGGAKAEIHIALPGGIDSPQRCELSSVRGVALIFYPGRATGQRA